MGARRKYGQIATWLSKFNANKTPTQKGEYNKLLFNLWFGELCWKNIGLVLFCKHWGLNHYFSNTILTSVVESRWRKKDTNVVSVLD